MKFRSRLVEGGPGSGIKGHKPGDAVPGTGTIADRHKALAQHHYDAANLARDLGDHKAAELHRQAQQDHSYAARAHKEKSKWRKSETDDAMASSKAAEKHASKDSLADRLRKRSDRADNIRAAQDNRSARLARAQGWDDEF